MVEREVFSVRSGTCLSHSKADMQGGGVALTNVQPQQTRKPPLPFLAVETSSIRMMQKKCQMAQ